MLNLQILSVFISCPDPDPAKSLGFDRIRIHNSATIYMHNIKYANTLPLKQKILPSISDFHSCNK